MVNNANVMRLIAAIVVLWGHGYSLNSGGHKHDPISIFIKSFIDTPYNKDIPGLGVILFFTLSGYLICKSYVQRNNLLHFTLLRMIRIYPALLINVCFVAIFIGILNSKLNFFEYLFNPGFHYYFLKCTTLITGITYRLPGVFLHNPMKGVNGSLWTLPWELYCYVGVGLLGSLTLLAKRRISAILLIVLCAFLPVFVTSPKILSVFFIVQAFLIGSAFYLSGLSLKNIPTWAILILYILVVNVVNEELITLTAFSLLVLKLAFFSKLKLPSFDRYGDFSYGMYLYAFPIQQLIIKFYSSELVVWQQNLIAIFITSLFAFLSWRLVESPILTRKQVILEWVDVTKLKLKYR
jgi:peptidoglycan/LPS O-acetylase OafA/YrhL